ncbi:MAG: lactate utilization protein [Candidatus Omnitrophica bacterium]|nr:lactate utilization protein [Candidatus Omnitrophota bacterium]
MENSIKQLIQNWQPRNIAGIFCANKQEATDKILSLVPPDASVGFSGSVTLDQLGIVSLLEKRGNRVANPYQKNLSRQESLKVRKIGPHSDFFLVSPNAISAYGELVFFSAFGNRIAGISYVDNVIVVSGVNKIVPDLSQAMKRAREFATPLNCKRLNWPAPCLSDGICKEKICRFPEYKRMCCQVLTIEAEVEPGRLKVILVGEELGF